MNYSSIMFLLAIGTFLVIPAVFADVTAEEFLSSEDPPDIKITLQGIGNDTKSGSIGNVIMMTTEQQNSEGNCKYIDLNYTMKNGHMLTTCYDNTPTLTILIRADSDDQMTIDVPKQLVYSFVNVDCGEGQMIILVDGEVVEPTIISSKTANKITMSVQKGTHQIEFIGTLPVPNPSPAMYCGIVMGYETQYLPPKLQLNLGMEPELVRCNQGLELAIKTSDGNPVCIAPSTKLILVERNWAKENNS